MPLDFWVRDDRGAELAHAALSMEAYSQLKEAAAKLPLLGRLKTFYGSEGDASFLPSEAARLKLELEEVERRVARLQQPGFGRLFEALRELKVVCDKAAQSGRSIQVLAD